MHVVNTLAPVFLIIALGAALRHWGFMSEATHKGLNRLSYWVAVPCLIFVKISQAPPTGGAAGVVAKILILGALGLTVLAIILALIFRMNRAQVGTFVQACFRSNLAFVGLPVVIFAFQGTRDAAIAEGVAALIMGPVVVVYNILAVSALLASQHAFGMKAVKRIVSGIVINPLLIACVLGLIWKWGVMPHGISLPVCASRPMDLVTGFALPATLMCVGAALVSTPLHGKILPAIISSLSKTVIGPILGFAIARLMDAGPTETVVSMLLLGCPTAAVSYVLTAELKGDTELAAAGIVVSTLASAATLSILLFITGGWIMA
jgi:predicted permease